MSEARRFIFRGEAVAVAGTIRRPTEIVIPPECSLALPTIGGRARAESKSKDYGNIVRYRNAAVSVDGDYVPARGKRPVDYTFGNHGQNRLPRRTTVEASVSGFEVRAADGKQLRRLTVGGAKTVLISEHSGTGREPSIRTGTLELAEFSIDGYALDVAFHDLFARFPTRAALDDAYRNRKSLYELLDRCLFGAAGSKPGTPRVLPETGGMIQGTVVESIRWRKEAHPEATIDGNRVSVPGLGSAFLGEIFVTANERRLAMMRLELGSPVGGEVEIAEAGTDGHLWPP
jgi:hypothetical protein